MNEKQSSRSLSKRYKDMLDVTLRDQIRNDEVQWAMSVDIAHWVAKISGVGYVVRRTDDRWVKTILEWRLRTEKRSVWRSPPDGPTTLLKLRGPIRSKLTKTYDVGTVGWGLCQLWPQHLQGWNDDDDYDYNITEK